MSTVLEVSAQPLAQTRPLASFRWAAVLLGTILALAHLAATWGYTGGFWGDYGLWLHEVDRFAHGETIYRDFYWPHPPLSLWLVGGAARIIGSDLTQIWLVTGGLYVAICATYLVYAGKLLTRSNLILTIASGMVLGFVYAGWRGAPLPLGMYTPAAPVGFLALLCALLLFLRPASSGQAIMLGCLAGACVITKHDYWVPAGYLVVLYAFHVQRRYAVLAIVSAFAVVMATVLVVAAQSGVQTLLGILGGFGHVAELGGAGLPTWERITAELMALSLVTLVVSSAMWLSGRRAVVYWLASLILLLAAGTLYYVMSGSGPVTAIQSRFLPAVLPTVAFGIVLFRPDLFTPERRRLLLQLLGFAIALRARRLFTGVDWYHILIELPVYVLLLEALVPRKRLVTAVLTLLIAVGTIQYWRVGQGALTRRAHHEWVQTARGSVRQSPEYAALFNWLETTMDGADPARERPIFALGYVGGFAYFLGRTNPAPATQGFRLSAWPPEQIVQSAVQALPFVIDNRTFRRARVPVNRLAWRRWRARTVLSHYATYDLPYFQRVIAGCHTLGTYVHSVRGFTLYDCGQPDRRGP